MLMLHAKKCELDFTLKSTFKDFDVNVRVQDLSVEGEALPFSGPIIIYSLFPSIMNFPKSMGIQYSSIQSTKV